MFSMRYATFYILLSAIFSIVVLWQLLLPGYVLLLDWTAGPEPYMQYAHVADMMSVPVDGLRYLLVSLMPGWIVQKGILVGLTFCLLWVPLRYSFFAQSSPARYFCALFLALNPFVYERLLAGQWRVVAGYVLMYALLYVLVRFLGPSVAVLTRRNIFCIFGVLFLLGVFSIHFYVIGVLLVFFWTVWFFGKTLARCVRAHVWDDLLHNFLYFLGGGLLFLLVSLYWIVPYVFVDGSLLETFGSEDAEAFVTAEGERIGALLNVIIMHGFWGEARGWAQAFIFPKSLSFSFLVGFLGFVVLMFVGFFARSARCATHSIQDRMFSSAQRYFLLSVSVFALIFSVGVSSTFFQEMNQWLFDHVGFWSGFRDTQKWSGVLVIVYGIFAASGLSVLTGYVCARLGASRARSLGAVFFLVPVLMTPMMLLGFHEQVQSSSYPDSWRGANALLSQTSPCKMLFLPWHQYYPLAHNGSMLGANVSKRFFSCEVVSGENTELDGIASFGQDSQEYRAVEEIVVSNDTNQNVITDQIVSLRSLGFTHIVMTSDLVDSDVYRYPFVLEETLAEVYRGEGIVVYTL